MAVDHKSTSPSHSVKNEPNEGGESEDDPVVLDIPVYLSKAGNCYLYQYPVRPGHMTYDGTHVVRARVRPVNQQAQLEIAINTNSDNYDKSKGEQIALNTDGSDAGHSKYFKSSMMDKQVLTGSTPVSSTGRYALAIMDNDELHLTPVKGVLQLRPSLGYMDKSDRTARLDGIDDEYSKPQAVAVRFKGDSDRLKKLKESFNYQMKMVEEEPWVECEYQQARTGDWDSVCQKLFCNKTNPVTVLNSSTQQYLCDMKDLNEIL